MTISPCNQCQRGLNSFFFAEPFLSFVHLLSSVRQRQRRHLGGKFDYLPGIPCSLLLALLSDLLDAYGSSSHNSTARELVPIVPPHRQLPAQSLLSPDNVEL